jgi:excisionase family DNA binding protein
MSEEEQFVRGHLDRVNTVEEVAAFVKVSTKTVRRAIGNGQLEALHAGTRIRISDRAVWAWLEAGRRSS